MHEPERAGISWSSLSMVSRIYYQVRTYICADLRSSIPDPDSFDIPSHEEFSLPLLPINYKSRIFVAWD